MIWVLSASKLFFFGQSRNLFSQSFDISHNYLLDCFSLLQIGSEEDMVRLQTLK